MIPGGNGGGTAAGVRKDGPGCIACDKKNQQKGVRGIMEKGRPTDPKIMAGGKFMWQKISLFGSVGLALFMLLACAPVAPQVSGTNGVEMESAAGAPREIEVPETVVAEASVEKIGDAVLPVRFQSPSYLVRESEMEMAPGQTEGIAMPVGADIKTTTVPVTLREILKRLTMLKGMNVSWASDVDQYVLVDVDISSTDDFFAAIDNLLRQVDYFHEVRDNTIVVKYKETRKFHIALPPRIMGSNTSGSSAASSATNVEASTRWEQIRRNLDQVLQVWAEKVLNVPPAPVSAEGAAGFASEPPTAAPADTGYGGAPAAPASRATTQRTPAYYSINEEIGLIIVTAPRPLLEKVAVYIDNLKDELYRQISIEAKIVEVTLNNNSKSGIDWRDLFSNNTLGFNVEFGDPAGLGAGEIFPNGTFINRVTLGNKGFNLILDAIQNYGETRVLSNPKISVMNGQPAVIYVGDKVTYIDKVETTVEEGTVSTAVNTTQASSGLRLEVFATIIDDDEIILSLIPMTSVLTQPIEYRTFGTLEVGLPEIRERTMNSIVRVKNGEMLVVGGMIDSTNDKNENKVKGLGDLPLINKLFKSEADSLVRRELIILLRPQIL